MTSADTSEAVDAFMARLEHPAKAEIQALRTLILGVDPSVQEGIKWNAPSYRSSEYFATTHLRGKKGVAIVLHLGAKARELPAGGIQIDDPTALLKWPAKDRAIVQFDNAADVEAKRTPFKEILRQWLAYV